MSHEHSVPPRHPHETKANGNHPFLRGLWKENPGEMGPNAQNHCWRIPERVLHPQTLQKNVEAKAPGATAVSRVPGLGPRAS